MHLLRYLSSTVLYMAHCPHSFYSQFLEHGLPMGCQMR